MIFFESILGIFSYLDLLILNLKARINKISRDKIVNCLLFDQAFNRNPTDIILPMLQEGIRSEVRRLYSHLQESQSDRHLRQLSDRTF